MKKTLSQIHTDVPANHYDSGFKNNIFQRIWHERRIDELKKMIPKNLGIVLDVGCHSGFLTEKIIKNNSATNVYGIDISKEAIKLAQKRIARGEFKVADAHALPFKENYFDTVLCLEILEHIEKPKKVISEIRRVLKKDGRAIILVPTDNALFRFIWFVWNTVYPVWKHAHIQSFKSNKLVGLLEKKGFKVEQEKRFNLNMLLLVKAKK